MTFWTEKSCFGPKSRHFRGKRRQNRVPFYVRPLLLGSERRDREQELTGLKWVRKMTRNDHKIPTFPPFLAKAYCRTQQIGPLTQKWTLFTDSLVHKMHHFPQPWMPRIRTCRNYDACEDVGPCLLHCFHTQRTCRSVNPSGSKGKRQGTGLHEDVGAGPVVGPGGGGGGTIPCWPHPCTEMVPPRYPTPYPPGHHTVPEYHAAQPRNASTTADFLIR